MVDLNEVDVLNGSDEPTNVRLLGHRILPPREELGIVLDSPERLNRREALILLSATPSGDVESVHHVVSNGLHMRHRQVLGSGRRRSTIRIESPAGEAGRDERNLRRLERSRCGRVHD